MPIENEIAEFLLKYQESQENFTLEDFGKEKNWIIYKPLLQGLYCR